MGRTPGEQEMSYQPGRHFLQIPGPTNIQIADRNDRCIELKRGFVANVIQIISHPCDQVIERGERV